MVAPLMLLERVRGWVLACVSCCARAKPFSVEFSDGGRLPELWLARGATPHEEALFFPGCSSSVGGSSSTPLREAAPATPQVACSRR